VVTGGDELPQTRRGFGNRIGGGDTDNVESLALAIGDERRLGGRRI
jgi:hypothetical protein